MTIFVILVCCANLCVCAFGIQAFRRMNRTSLQAIAMAGKHRDAIATYKAAEEELERITFALIQEQKRDSS